MSVYLLDGKVLLDSGHIAAAEACCCGGCTCPNGDTIPSFTIDFGQVDPCFTTCVGSGSLTWDGSTWSGGFTVDCGICSIFVTVAIYCVGDGSWFLNASLTNDGCPDLCFGLIGDWSITGFLFVVSCDPPYGTVSATLTDTSGNGLPDVNFTMHLSA